MVAPIRPQQLDTIRAKMLRETEQLLNRMLGNPTDRHATTQSPQHNANDLRTTRQLR